MRISDWSSDVCSSDLWSCPKRTASESSASWPPTSARRCIAANRCCRQSCQRRENRSEEHTSELQSLMRTSYAVFCLKKKKNQTSETQSLMIMSYDYVC